MAISRSAIVERMSPALEWGDRLVIEPLLVNVSADAPEAASLDFHLGNRFTIPRSRRAVEHDPLADEARRDVVPQEIFIPMGQEFSLRPGQLVLGTTLEWFRFPKDLMAHVIGRSIWGRRGLLIVTAQAVHPGSSGTITLELSNVGQVGLRLRPGASIGQLFFEEVPSKKGWRGRESPFAGALRPVLGKYRRTKVEDMLLNLR